MIQCCSRAYFCPTVGEIECHVHGGFDICCDQNDLHEQPVTHEHRRIDEETNRRAREQR